MTLKFGDKMSFTLTQPLPFVIGAEYDTQANLGKAFCRMEEFYESPEYAGKIFKRNELFAWFKKKYKKDYLEEWEGFNVPDWVVRVFKHGLFNPMTKQELELFNALEIPEKKFYLIGYVRGDKPTFLHEVAHALYAEIPSYRNKVVSLRPLYEVRGLSKALLSMGYSLGVLADESHAYCMFDREYLKKTHNVDVPAPLTDALLKNFYEFYHESKTDNSPSH